MKFKDLKNKEVVLFLSGGFNLSGLVLTIDKKTILIKTADGDDFLIFKNKILAINLISSLKNKDLKGPGISSGNLEKESVSFLNDNVFVVRTKNKTQNDLAESQEQEKEDRYIPIDLTNMRKPDKISGNYDEDFSVSLASLQSVPSQTRPENKR